jgi:hypothetical protein
MSRTIVVFPVCLGPTTFTTRVVRSEFCTLAVRCRGMISMESGPEIELLANKKKSYLSSLNFHGPQRS